MPSAANLTPEQRFVGLFIGPSKSGKTCAGATFPGPIRAFDFDGRIRGILGCPWIKKDQIEYNYYPPKGIGGKPIYQLLNDEAEALMVMQNQGKLPFKTALVGSLTSAAFAFLCDAIPLTHADNKGKKIGVLNMAGPEDYGFEATAVYNFIAFLRSLPINLIVDAHIVDRYGRLDPNDKYSEKVVIGEKLSIRDKIGENVMIYFDHVFRFDKQGETTEKYTVKFRGGLASTSFEKLPQGEHDITGKNFYEFMLNKAQGTITTTVK